MAKEDEAQNFFFAHHQQHHLSFNNISILSNNNNTNTINNSSSVNNIKNNNNKYINDSNNNIVVIVIIVMLVVLLILAFIACKCKPWRYFFASSSSSTSRSRTIKADDIERPLIPEDSSSVQNQSRSNNVEVSDNNNKSEGVSSSPLIHKQKSPSTSHLLTHSDSFVLDIPEKSEEDGFVGQTLRRPLTEKGKYGRKEDTKYSSRFDINNESPKDVSPKNTGVQRSILMLEVIAGPSQGLNYTIQSSNTSKLPLTLGRVSPSHLVVNDIEVSGKHAHINWNLNKLKWELVDMGSLNGTHLNSNPIHHPNPGSRQWGDPVELSSRDVITLGTTSKIFVEITSQTECEFPFAVGFASDPMALRRGGRKLPMEDVCYYQWPIPGTQEFGLFGICDGHGGAGAAKSVSKIMPEIVGKILSDAYKKEKVLSKNDASDVLREAFSETEAIIDHNYEGCTATLLLLWGDGHNNFYAQCANVGDSACIIDINGKQIKMSEDHRVTSYTERLRIQALGEPLRDGETRICGLNLARVLGDKFLKEQDARFSSEPYISEVVYINEASNAFALIASDGFWDVVNVKKAVQLVERIKEKHSNDEEKCAERIANALLNEARTQRTKDNTSVIFLDFDSTNGNGNGNGMYPCKLDP